MTETILLPSSVELQEVVYQDKIQVMQRVVAQFEGFSKEYIVSDHGKRAALLVLCRGQVLLTKQYRLLINAISLELPGGRVEQNENPADAARRECLEETGVNCSSLSPLVSYHPSLDVLKNYTSIFLSEEINAVMQEKASHRVWLPLVHCINMIFAGESILDGMSMLALFAYVARTRTKN